MGNVIDTHAHHVTSKIVDTNIIYITSFIFMRSHCALCLIRKIQARIQSECMLCNNQRKGENKRKCDSVHVTLATIDLAGVIVPFSYNF